MGSVRIAWRVMCRAESGALPMYHEFVVPNAGFWVSHIRQIHVPAIKGFRSGALEKVAPAFGGIKEEANAAAKAEYERLVSMPVDPDGWFDMGDAAELATEHGIEYYGTMSGVRQGVLNLLAVGLHHLFEQQQLFFLQQALAGGEDGSFRTAELEEHLACCSIDCRSFACAGKLYELKQAANAIKHGNGASAKELARLRPDLFEDPVLARLGWAECTDEGAARVAERASSLFAPLAGDDLYVSERDLSEWCDAVIAYWEDLSAILDAQ